MSFFNIFKNFMLHSKTNGVIKLLLIFLLLFSLCSCKTIEIDVHMFSNIKECQVIESLNDNANVKIIASPDEDKYFKDLQFQNFFGCEYTSDDLTFELFAYEFSNADMAMSYFENSTGKGEDPNSTFCDSTGMLWFKRIVVKENKAYAVRCKKEYKEKMDKLADEGVFLYFLETPDFPLLEKDYESLTNIALFLFSKIENI